MVAAPGDAGGKLEIPAREDQQRPFGRDVEAFDHGPGERQVAKPDRDRACRRQQLRRKEEGEARLAFLALVGLEQMERVSTGHSIPRLAAVPPQGP